MSLINCNKYIKLFFIKNKHKKMSENKNPSIRTEYGKNKHNKKNPINRIKSPQIKKRVEYNNRNMNHVKDSWSNMISRTSKEGQNKVSNNPSFQSNILSSNPYFNPEIKNHFKKSNNYEMSTTTQITTLPGGVKRNIIKDDMYLKKPFNESRMYKMIHDYNSDINYKDNYNPITQGYNVNEFPSYERYYGSFRKGVKDHDIFNAKIYNKYKYY